MKIKQLMSNINSSTGLKDEALQAAALSTASIMAFVEGRTKQASALQNQAAKRLKTLSEKQADQPNLSNS